MIVPFANHVRLQWDETKQRLVPSPTKPPQPIRYSQRFVDLWALICFLALVAVIALFATGVVE